MKQDQDRPDEAEEGGLPLAKAIGTRNLLIIIVTMPLVFLVVVLAVISFFGEPARQAREARAETPMETLQQPASVYRGAVEPLSVSGANDPSPIEVPAGSRIAAMALDGERLVLRIEDEAGNGEIVIYDVAAGAPLRVIPVRRAPEL